MAEHDFEDEVRAMFGAAPPAPDAQAFAARVDRRIAERRVARLVLICALGLTGLAVTWLMFGLSPADLTAGLAPASPIRNGDAMGNAGLWAAAVLAATGLWLLVRPLLPEA